MSNCNSRGPTASESDIVGSDILNSNGKVDGKVKVQYIDPVFKTQDKDGNIYIYRNTCFMMAHGDNKKGGKMFKELKNIYKIMHNNKLT